MMGQGTSIGRSHWSALSSRRSGEIHGTIPLDYGTAPRLRTDRREQEVNTFLPKENVTQPFCQASSVSMMMNHAEMWRPVHVPWSTMPAVVRIHRPHPSTTSTRAEMGNQPAIVSRVAGPTVFLVRDRDAPDPQLSSFFLVCKPSTLARYKREGVHPVEGGFFRRPFRSNSRDTNSGRTNQLHTHTHDSETWDPQSLSRPFVNPYYKL